MHFINIHSVFFTRLFSSNPHTARSNKHSSLLNDIPLALHSQASAGIFSNMPPTCVQCHSFGQVSLNFTANLHESQLPDNVQRANAVNACKHAVC